MEIPVIYIFTHDSIGVGEDGPTHQPVEQLAALRAIPGLITLRPADANEVVEAWKFIMPLQARAGRAGPDAPGPADARPHEVRLGRGAAARRLRPGRRAGRQARRAAAGHRQRGGPGPGRLREAEGRGGQGAGRQHAVVGALRAALPRASGVPRAGAARRGHGAGVGRAGLDLRLGALRRHGRRDDRHAHLRRLGPAQGTAEEVRLHPRRGGRRGAGTTDAAFSRERRDGRGRTCGRSKRTRG